MSSPLSLVIVGGGFAGVEVAKKMSASSSWNITLIDPQEAFLFTPRLVDALSNEAVAEHLRVPHKTLAETHRYSFLQGTVLAIDTHRKTVQVQQGDRAHALAYDMLVLTQGARTQFYGTPGAEHAFPLKTWSDLETLEAHLIQLAEVPAKKTEEARSTFCVVGGGASGVEAILALQTRVRKQFRAEKRPFSFFLIQAAPEILPGFLPATIKKTRALLETRGITILTGDSVASVSETALTTKTGRIIPTSTVVWTAGLQPNAIPMESARSDQPPSYLLTDPFLRINETIFAAGDIVVFKDKQITVPKNAQTAMKMAEALAENLERTRLQRSLRPFHYHSFGVILWLEQTGILDLFGYSLESRLVPMLRNFFYNIRFWQLTR